MKRKIIWILGAIILAAALILAGYNLLPHLDDAFFGGQDWEHSVVVGASARESFLAEHPETVKVMLMADFAEARQLEDEINGSGILGRRKLQLVQGRQGATLAEQLATLACVTRDASYFAVVGPTGSERALHAAEILAMADVPLLPLSAISPRLSDFPHTLMVHPSVRTEVSVLMDDFETNGVTRLGIVNDEALDWAIRGMAMEDEAVKHCIDVPTHVFFNSNEGAEWMLFIAEHHIGTSGVAMLAPQEGYSSDFVVQRIHVRYDKDGPLRILSLPKTDRMADIRRTVWVFATAFAKAERSGCPTAKTFIRAAMEAPVKTPLGTLSFGPDRFLAPDCPIVPLVR